MPTYAQPKASFWVGLSLNKEGTHFANIGLHLLMVVIGVRQVDAKCMPMFVFVRVEYGLLTKYTTSAHQNTQQLVHIRHFYWRGYHFDWFEGSYTC